MKYSGRLIEVTQDHIDRGVRKDSRCCPIALAIKEQIGNQNTFVGEIVCIDGEIYITTAFMFYWYRCFDNCESLGPFNISTLAEKLF